MVSTKDASKRIIICYVKSFIFECVIFILVISKNRYVARITEPIADPPTSSGPLRTKFCSRVKIKKRYCYQKVLLLLTSLLVRGHSLRLKFGLSTYYFRIDVKPRFELIIIGCSLVTALEKLCRLRIRVVICVYVQSSAVV